MKESRLIIKAILKQIVYYCRKANILFSGTMPRLTKVSLEVAIAFTMYNAFLDLFFKSNLK